MRKVKSILNVSAEKAENRATLIALIIVAIVIILGFLLRVILKI